MSPLLYQLSYTATPSHCRDSLYHSEKHGVKIIHLESLPHDGPLQGGLWFLRYGDSLSSEIKVECKPANAEVHPGWSLLLFLQEK